MLIRRLSIYTAALLVFAACADQLDQSPQTSILSDNYYTTEDNVETTVTACYNSLQELYDYYMILFGEIPSDNTYVQAPNSNTGVSPLEDFTWTSTTTFASSIWENTYEGVLYANTVLDVIDDITFDSETTRTTRIGEVKALRGFFYDNLVAIYGAVPLVIAIEDPTDAFDYTRTDVADVYEQIETDLEEAIEALPTSNSTGRVNQYVARAFLAKHYMRTGDYESAEKQLAAIVESSEYALVDIDALYGVDNEGNDEDIFSVQFVSELDDEGSSYYYYFTQPDDDGGKGAMAMEAAMYNAYETGDLRQDLIDVSSSTYYINKWTYYSDTDDGGSNHFLVRYADILLQYAECLNENGSTSDAITYLDMVRDRAGLDGTTASSQDDVRDAIATERRFELVGEGHRWFDLLRTGTAIETMNAFFTSEGDDITVEEYRLLAPIPQSEIDITEMEQNPGY